MWGGNWLDGLYTLLIILFVATLLGLGYFIYNFFFFDKKVIKTQVKPAITWELKAKGQKVDTVWVYKFK